MSRYTSYAWVTRLCRISHPLHFLALWFEYVYTYVYTCWSERQGLSHVAHMIESCHSHEWVMTNIEYVYVIGIHLIDIHMSCHKYICHRYIFHGHIWHDPSGVNPVTNTNELYRVCICHRETWGAGVDIHTVDTRPSLFQFRTHFLVRFVSNKLPLPRDH